MCPRIILVVVLAIVAPCGPAWAQLDPLLFLKTTKPNVLLVVDTGERMQRDADGNYYDPFIYTKTGATWEPTLGVTSSNTNVEYRRTFINLQYVNTGGNQAEAQTIQVTGDLDASFAQFEARTRLSLARAALSEAVRQNQEVARFGLLKTRQLNPALGSQGNFNPVLSTDLLQEAPAETGASLWTMTRPTVSVSNGSLTGIQSPLVQPDAATANADILSILSKSLQTAGALISAGNDGVGIVDEPLQYMLDDAQAEALRLTLADILSPKCRNTVVVLVVGGKEGTTASAHDPVGAALSFLLNFSGRRVPIYVVGIAPPAADSTQLQAIATAGGGQYFEITKTMIDQTPAGQPVPELVRAVNVAVQHTFASPSDFNTAPTAQLPFGPTTEFQVTSPVVGTVNLENATDINGAILPETRVLAPSGAVLPQRSNIMVTTAFALPGFDARLRAFRMYRPVADATKPTGYRFVSDGTRLWVASTPAAASRNIYTVLPDGTLTAFSTTNASLLAPYLNTSDPAALIDFVRNQPLGAVVGSTPAIMDPPSIDPPPDDDYPVFATANKDRRALVWVGANDGMLHAIDARLGVEVWALIPFNLLPKLRALHDGQAVGTFDYFVDSSPKIADVKVGDAWRTYLVLGEGAGGTFYQTLDVTMGGKSPMPSPTDNTIASVLSYFAEPSPIHFEWSFPSYTEFDYTLSPYGDISASASAVAKSVGETWSDPAVGQIGDQDGKFAVLTGSGFLAHSKQQQSNRGGTVAGATFYLLDIEDGAPFDSKSVGSDGIAETVNDCAVVNDCTKLKNALQADPVATGPPDSRYITMVYIGDLDGAVWRFSISTGVSGTPVLSNPLKLFDNTAAHPLFSSMATVNIGTTQQFVFYGTGSDLLPSNGVDHQYKLVGILDQGSTASQRFSQALTKTDGAGDDEKVTAFPAVAGDIVFFSTTSFKPETPCTAPDANLYALTFIGGPAYDNSGDNTITTADTPKVKTIVGARASAPFIVDQHLVFAAGSKVEIFGDPQDYNNGVGQAGVRILSWREVR